MSDRLPKLLQQRALIQEHLARLDREIAEASGIPPLPTTGLPPSPDALRQTTRSTTTSDRSNEAENILGQYNVDANVVKTDARRGCLTIFFAGFGLFILVVAIGYYLYGRHLGRWW